MAVYTKEIALNFGFNVFRAIGVLECVVSLFIMKARWTDANDHDGLAVASKREFQKAGQFTVTIWDMLFLLGGIAEGVDAISQCQKRPVDVGALKGCTNSI